MAKILLVEDNEMNRDMLSRRLERRGYEVVIAVDGQQGVDLAQSQPPDLILMDMSLPVHRRLGGDPAAQGRRDDIKAIPDHRPDRPRHVRRPREGAGGGLRRLRHQAHRAAAAAGEDRSAPRGPRQAAGMSRRGRPAGPRPRRPARAHAPRAAHARQRHPRLQRDAARGRTDAGADAGADLRADPGRRPHAARPDQRDPGPRAIEARGQRRTWRRRARASATTCARRSTRSSATARC